MATKIKTSVTTIATYPVYEEWVSKIAADKTISEILQPRTKLDMDWVIDYAEGYGRGDPIPPLVAFRLPDGRLVLVDGFHRLESQWRQHKGEKDFKVQVQVREGSMNDALVYAIAANQAKLHKGRPFTKDDRRRSAELMIRNGAGEPGKGTWDWSDTAIGKQCGVSPGTVIRVRLKLRDEVGIPLPDRVQRIDPKRGTPTGAIAPYKMSFSTGSPAISKGESGRYFRSRIGGKNVFLGKDEQAAMRKLGDIVEQRIASQSALNRAANFRDWLQTRLINVQSDVRLRGAVILASDVALWPVADDEHKAVLAAIACGVLSRIAIPEVRRAILVGYLDSARGDTGRFIALARQLTPPIEFMTPEEVVAEFGPK